jgi:hypothetical protein
MRDLTWTFIFMSDSYFLLLLFYSLSVVLTMKSRVEQSRLLGNPCLKCRHGLYRTWPNLFPEMFLHVSTKPNLSAQ